MRLKYAKFRPVVEKKRRGRPPKDEPSVAIPVTVPPRLAQYLDDLIEIQGYGETRPEIMRRFVWDAVNELIAKGRLRQRGPDNTQGGGIDHAQ